MECLPRYYISGERDETLLSWNLHSSRGRQTNTETMKESISNRWKCYGPEKVGWWVEGAAVGYGAVVEEGPLRGGDI